MSIFDTAYVITNYEDPYDPDVMSISRSGNNFTASFTRQRRALSLTAIVFSDSFLSLRIQCCQRMMISWVISPMRNPG